MECTGTDYGVWVLGAPDALAPRLAGPPLTEVVARRTALGLRVLVLAWAVEASAPLRDGDGRAQLPVLEPLAVVALADELLPQVTQTVQRLGREGVALEVFLTAWARPTPPDPHLLGSVARFVIPAAVLTAVGGVAVYAYLYTLVAAGLTEADMPPGVIEAFEGYTGLTDGVDADFTEAAATIGAQTGLSTPWPRSC